MCSVNDFNSTLFSSKCEYVTNNTEVCHFDDGFIQYLHIIYCGFSPQLLPLAICLLFLWLFLLLIGLATTADGFFGPCLIVMAQTLKLSQNLAGVTLLALGNGAPDIFSALSAITQLTGGDAGLAFGGLLGAGLFVTCVTAGAIAIVQPFDSMRRPIIKDMIFYLFAVFWAFVILMKNEMTVYESAGFIGVYVVYVCITVVSRGVFAHSHTSKSSKEDSGEEDVIKPAEIGMNPAFDHDSESGPVLKSKEVISSKPISKRFQQLDYSNSGFDDDNHSPKLSFISEKTESSDTGIDAEILRRHLSQLSEETPEGIYYEESGPIRSNSAVAPSREPRKHLNNETVKERLSHMEERNKRISRTSKHHQQQKSSTSSSNAELKKKSEDESSRKLSQNVLGFEAKANYLTRWLITYGGADELERHLANENVTGTNKKSTAAKNEKSRSVSTNSQINSTVKTSEAQSDRKVSNIILQNNLRGPFVVHKISSSSMSLKKKLSGQPQTSHSIKVPEEELNRRKKMDTIENDYDSDVEDRNKRISRIQMHSNTHSPNLSFCHGVPMPGIDRKAGYMARYIMSHGEPCYQNKHADVPKHKSNPKTYRRNSSIVYDEHLDLGFTVSVPSSTRSSTISNHSNLTTNELEKESTNHVISKNEDDAQKGDVEEEEENEDDVVLNPWVEFLYSVSPIDLLEWREMSIANKIYEIIKSPIMFIIQLTTAVVDYDRPMNGWSRILNSLHCITAPLFWMFAFKLYHTSIAENFPLWALILSIGVLMALVVYFTSEHWQPPRYHAFFAFFGFLTAIVWIYTLANGVVNILETLGTIFNISTVFLGVTLLAWANSIGDVVSNVVLARQGFPRIAISACFGGPLFNLLLGFGIPFLIKTIELKGKIKLNVSLLQVILTSFLLVGLLISLIGFPLMKFHTRRSYGVILIIFYLIFFVLAILTEVKVIPKFDI